MSEKQMSQITDIMSQFDTMTSEQINDKMQEILQKLNKKCGATLREE